jgi:hypothetical protein
MLPQKQQSKAATLCGRCWRVWVTVRGKHHIGAVADIIDVPTAGDAVAIVMNSWTNDDWDPEAFAFLDKVGNWRHYRLCDTDEIVFERVVAAPDLELPAWLIGWTSAPSQF